MKYRKGTMTRQQLENVFADVERAICTGGESGVAHVLFYGGRRADTDATVSNVRFSTATLDRLGNDRINVCQIAVEDINRDCNADIVVFCEEEVLLVSSRIDTIYYSSGDDVFCGGSGDGVLIEGDDSYDDYGVSGHSYMPGGLVIKDFIDGARQGDPAGAGGVEYNAIARQKKENVSDAPPRSFRRRIFRFFETIRAYVANEEPQLSDE